MRQNKMIMRSLVLLGALFFWGNSFAQISLSVNKQTIKQIIPQIEKASGYNVFYTDKLPNLETKKDLNVSNASLETVLKELFKGTKISFEIKAKKQIISAFLYRLALFIQTTGISDNRSFLFSKDSDSRLR